MLYDANIKIYTKMRNFYKQIFDPFLEFCNKFNVHINLFTFMVFLFTGFMVLFLMIEQSAQAGAMGILVAVADIIGSLLAEKRAATLRAKEALLDSILDRYAEIMLYSGMLVFCIQAENFLYVLFVYLALVGSLMASFIRLRAESFGIDANFGFIQRPERIILLSLGMFLGLHGIGISSLIVAMISNFTACYLISRIWFVHHK